MSRPESAPFERRAEPRVPANAPARLFYGPKLSLWADCAIRNLSVSGARIELPQVHVAPPRFVLLHFQADVAYDAVLKWRRGDMAGMAFENRTSLADCDDPRLASIVELWRALRPGFGAAG
jgi:hypothetical protein